MTSLNGFASFLWFSETNDLTPTSMRSKRNFLRFSISRMAKSTTASYEERDSPSPSPFPPPPPPIINAFFVALANDSTQFVKIELNLEALSSVFNTVSVTRDTKSAIFCSTPRTPELKLTPPSLLELLGAKELPISISFALCTLFITPIAIKSDTASITSGWRAQRNTRLNRFGIGLEYTSNPAVLSFSFLPFASFFCFFSFSFFSSSSSDVPHPLPLSLLFSSSSSESSKSRVSSSSSSFKTKSLTSTATACASSLSA